MKGIREKWRKLDVAEKAKYCIILSSEGVIVFLPKKWALKIRCCSDCLWTVAT